MPSPEITRRDLLIKVGTLTGAAMVVSACAPEKTPPFKAPESYTEIPLEDSIKFVTAEMKANENLAGLRNYDPEKKKAFMGHAYNIYARVTQSPLTADQLVKMTTLGTAASIRTAAEQDARAKGMTLTAATNTSDISAITYAVNGDPATIGIMFNQEQAAYSLPTLRAATNYPNPRRTVLGAFLFGLTHEPIHAERKYQAISGQPAYIDTRGRRWDFTGLNGLDVFARVTGEPTLGYLGELDEASANIIQTDIIAPALPEIYEQYPTIAKEKQEALKAFLAKLDIPDGQALLEYRRAGGNGLQMRDQLIPHLPTNIQNQQQTAWNILRTINEALHKPNAAEAAQEIRQIAGYLR